MAGAVAIQGWVRPPSLALCADECGAKCCQNRMVLLTPDEARRLPAMGALVAKGSDGRWAMLMMPKCTFLSKTNRCGIYAQRPAACRAFPQRPMPGCLIWPKDA